MLKNYYPKLKVDSIQQIDFEKLINNNIKGLILDIDNTLVPQHMPDADEKAIKWIEEAKRAGLKACIVSNAREKRVVRFNERLKIFAVHEAWKPGAKGYLKAMELMNIKKEETAVVGDQIFTDIYGGNKLGLYTILVNPIDKKEVFWVRLKRIPEKMILKSYRKSIK